MHEKLEALKPLLKAGEYEKAAEALKTYREEFPDNWDGKLMEGLIAQLRGDEKTFRRIHDEAQAAIAKNDDQAAQIQTSPLWKKYHKAWGCITEAVIICLVTAVLAGTSAFFLLRTVRMRVQWVWDVILYGQPRPTPEWPSRPIRPPYMPTEDFTDGIDTDRIID